MKPKTFKPGDTVVFDPQGLNQEWWSKQSEADKLKWYGPLGYGAKKLHLFTFICEHSPQAGHCVLISMQDQHVETMRHTSDFRLATEEEA